MNNISINYSQLGSISIFSGLDLNEEMGYINLPENVLTLRFFENNKHPAHLKEELISLLKKEVPNKKIVFFTHSMFLIREVMMFSVNNYIDVKYFDLENDKLEVYDDFTDSNMSLVKANLDLSDRTLKSI